MKLIVGLGNIGVEYEKTRHNIGFRIVEFWAEKQGTEKWSEKSKLHGLVAEADLNGEKIVLLKPTTLMNRSGLAVAAVMDFYKMEPNDVLIISDDWSLPFGEIRLKDKGGHGGHNGLRDIIEQLGTDEFARLKIGIRPDSVTEAEDPHPFVLKKFGEEEENLFVKEIMEKAVREIEGWAI